MITTFTINLYYIDESGARKKQKGYAELTNKILSFDYYKRILTYDKEQKILGPYKPKVNSFKYTINYSVNNKRKTKEYIFLVKLPK